VCRFLGQFVISLVLSLVGLISAVLLGRTVYRLVTFDPVLEAVYAVLLLAWFGSLGRMWFLTFANVLKAKHD
jgi:hypothetical protein